MTRHFGLMLVTICSQWIFASEGHWMSFENELGYKIKVPDCWMPRRDEYEGSGDRAENSSTVSIEARSDCPKKNKMDIKQIFVDIGWSYEVGYLEDFEKAKELTRPNADAWKNGRIVFAKPESAEGQNSIWEIEKLSNGDLRWMYYIFCPKIKIRVNAGQIAKPSAILISKIKAGDLSLPEPNLTIARSTKCVESKTKFQHKAK